MTVAEGEVVEQRWRVEMTSWGLVVACLLGRGLMTSFLSLRKRYRYLTQWIERFQLLRIRLLRELF